MFDLNKNQWISLCNKSIDGYDSTMWCEFDTLYVLEEYDGWKEQRRFKLHTLDTRSSRPTWNEEDNICIDGLPKGYFEWGYGQMFY